MVQDSAIEVKEKQANDLVEALCSEQKTDEQCKTLMDSIQQARKENPTILATISTKLAAMEKGPQRAIANDNLRSLQERIAANNASPEAQADVVALRTEIDVVQKELDALDKSKEATQPATPAPEGAKSGVSPDMQKQIQKDPEKWLPQSMNPREWTGKQIATVSAITLGAVGLFALWKWFRSEKSESAPAEKKSKWHRLLWVPALGLAGYLGWKIWEKHHNGYRETAKDKEKKEKRDYLPDVLPDALEKPAEAVIGGVEQGVSRAVEVFGPAATEFLNHEHTAEVVRRQQNGEFKSETAFWATMIGAMSLDGIDLVVDETSCTILSGGKLIECTSKIWGGLINGFSDGKIDLQEGCDLVATYIEGVFVYATSLAALKMITLNRFARGVNPMLETGLWPIFVIKRGVKGSWLVVRGAAEIGVADSATRLVIGREMDALRFHKLELGTFTRHFKTATEEGLWMRKEFVMQQWERLIQAEARSNISAKNLKGFQEVFGKSVEDFHTYVKRMKPENLPDWYVRSAKFNFPDVDPSKVTLAHMKKILINLDKKTSAATEAGEIVGPKLADIPDAALKTDASDAAKASTNSPKSAAPDGGDLKKAVGDDVVHSKPQTADSVVPKADGPDLKVVRQDGTTVDLGGKVVAEGDAAASMAKSMEGAAGAAIALDTKANARFTELLKQKPIADALNASGKDAKAVESLIATHFSTLDADTLIQLNRSTKAQELIAGALKTADEAEIARMMKSCTKAGRLWRIAGAGGGALGLGGDAFSIYIAIADFQEYGNKIEATNNPALAEFYGQCRLLCTAEGTASAVGLFYQGAAIYGSAKAGGGLVTALGTPAGLIALPITIAAVGVGLARKGLQESVEYHSIGEEELVTYPAGKILRHVSETTSLENLNWTQDLFLFDVAGAGNRGARAEAYSAYFRQISVDAVAPYTFNDLSEEVRQDITALPEAERAASLHAELEKQHKNALGAFINDAYQYIRLTTPSMELTDPQTLKRAETFARVQNLRRRTGQEPLDLRLDTIDATVGPAIKLETDAGAETLVILQNYPEQANTVLFTALRHELAFCEQRILSADYSNLRKLSADITMQNAARGLIAEQLLDAAREIAGQLHTKGILFSAADYGHAYDRMKNILNQDPNTVARECLAKPNLPHYQKMGGVPNRLSVLGMNDLLSRYRLTKTDILGETSETALPIENLQFYYADNIKSRKPILMRLPEGAATGFLAVTESLWTRSKLTGECTIVSGAVALEPGVHQFWHERSMPHVNENQPVVPASMPAYSAQMSTPRIRILSTPNSRPDFEIIVQESEERLAA